MLHVQLTSKSFLSRLKAVSALAGRRWPKPILESVQLEATADGRGVLRATNIEAFVAVEVPLLKVVEPGTIQLPTEKLHRLLAEARGAVTLEEAPAEKECAQQSTNSPTRKVTVRTPQGSMTLPAFDPKHFPVQEVGKTKATVTLAAWRLVRLVERTAFAADPHATRYALGSLTFGFENGTLDVVGTNGHSLAHASEPADGPGLKPPAHVVRERTRRLVPGGPARALAGLAEVLGSMDPALPPSLTLGFVRSGQLQITGKGLAFTARMVEGRFPAWQGSEPPPSPTAVRIDDPSRLQRALKEATRFTSKERPGMELRLRRYTLTLAVRNDEASTSVEFPVRNLSEDPEGEASVAIDPAPLLKYLVAQRGSFVLRFPPEVGQAFLCESEGFRYLFMPMERPEAPRVGASEPTEAPQDNDEEEVPTSEAMTE